MELLNPIAEMYLPDSGVIITPPQAYKAKLEGHGLFCPDYNCKDSQRILFVKKSQKGTLFFCHRRGFEHPIMPETLLHKSAVKWFLNKSVYDVPDNLLYSIGGILNIDFEKTKLEFRQLQNHIPDVVLSTTSGFTFAIEIIVTSDISNEKRKTIQAFGLPTLRIDLSDFYNENREQCRTDLQFIEQNLNRLMVDMDRKNWVSHYSKPNNDSGCMLILFGAVGISLLMLVKNILLIISKGCIYPPTIKLFIL